MNYEILYHLQDELHSIIKELSSDYYIGRVTDSTVYLHSRDEDDVNHYVRIGRNDVWFNKENAIRKELIPIVERIQNKLKEIEELRKYMFKNKKTNAAYDDPSKYPMFERTPMLKTSPKQTNVEIKITKSMVLNNEEYIVGDIVNITTCNSHLRCTNGGIKPLDIEEAQGRIVDFDKNTIVLDCSEQYNACIKNIFIDESLILIRKLVVLNENGI